MFVTIGSLNGFVDLFRFYFSASLRSVGYIVDWISHAFFFRKENNIPRVWLNRCLNVASQLWFVRFRICHRWNRRRLSFVGVRLNVMKANCKASLSNDVNITTKPKSNHISNKWLNVRSQWNSVGYILIYTVS